ncbi:hypothetical protein V6Z12_A09G036500 [Gossypium hirsutum]
MTPQSNASIRVPSFQPPTIRAEIAGFESGRGLRPNQRRWSTVLANTCKKKRERNNSKQTKQIWKEIKDFFPKYIVNSGYKSLNQIRCKGPDFYRYTKKYTYILLTEEIRSRVHFRR